MRRQRKNRSAESQQPARTETKPAAEKKGGWSPPAGATSRPKPRAKPTATIPSNGTKTTSYPQRGRGGARSARQGLTTTYPNAPATGHRGYESLN